MATITGYYIDEDDFAISHKYKDWNAYEASHPNSPPIETLEEWIEETTGIINENIGSFNVNITDVRFLSRVQKLCVRMTNRVQQIDLAQGLPARIPMFSPNDFLIDRERKYLQSTVGVVLGYRGIGGSGI